jgi:hypothetical protein
MIFLPGLSGQYIAVADSDEEAQSYKPAVEQCLQVRLAGVWGREEQCLQVGG